MPPQIVSSSEDAPGFSCDVLVVGAHSSGGGVELAAGGSEIDAATDGALSKYLKDASFKAKIGDVIVLPSFGRVAAKSLAVVGLGKADALDTTALRRAAGSAARKVSDHTDIASLLQRTLPGDAATNAVVEGLLLGSYRFTSYKSDPQPSKIEKISLLGEASEQAIERGTARAEATALARDLVNEPPSSLTPDALGRRAQELADVAGLECEIFDRDELERRGFGGILGVSRGSAEPPRLIVLRYRPDNPKGKVALVGKGITFDSGGLSLKDAKNMEQMKTDMSGAAAVVGTMSALKRCGVAVEVAAYICCSENMPSGTAIKPGDVITHYGGGTSEVTNTDAEGRLVLADGIAFAAEQKPEAIIDVATLTGAIMVALGAKVSGFFSNDDALASEIEAAAADSGERLWRMPLTDEYRSDIDSEVADIKNSGPRWGGAIIGALFLKNFHVGGIPWAHMDIAGPARAESDYEEIPRGGSGVATRTLISWLENRGQR